MERHSLPNPSLQLQTPSRPKTNLAAHRFCACIYDFCSRALLPGRTISLIYINVSHSLQTSPPFRTMSRSLLLQCPRRLRRSYYAIAITARSYAIEPILPDATHTPAGSPFPGPCTHARSSQGDCAQRRAHTYSISPTGAMFISR